jgi:hypothetical protein
MPSGCPVTRTVCTTFQFAGVNTTCGWLTRPSFTLLEESGIVTSAVGCEASRILMVAYPPASLVAATVGLTNTPAANRHLDSMRSASCRRH